MATARDEPAVEEAADRLYHDPALVRFYDLDNAGGDDLAWCRAMAADAGSVLDLGCGTGALAASLGGACVVVGVDPAGAMLEVARRRQGGQLVTWVEADARDLELDRCFDLVVLTGHAFQVFLGDDDQRAVLATIARHLAPGGRFIFDARNPAFERWREWTPDASRRQFHDPDLGTIEAWNDVAYDASTGIATYETHYLALASGQRWSAASRIRFTPRDELGGRIAEAGLDVGQWLGDWRGRPFTPASPEIIPLGGGL
jgi:SAM-dependent methyltransferase